ncbi:MAG: 4Fe-4S binding protein [Firmicutes bacterium]|jgi:Fe-S-cluster-containing hydrogenase component 2|nr:4Fe-4S binding protein [Bacillota bacterium]
MRQRAVAVIECPQEIPCNPCETACPRGAIRVGEPITNCPELDATLCSGCGLCLTACPGLAIFLVARNPGGEAEVTFPYEFLPLPELGAEVEAVNRKGQRVGTGRVVAVRQPKGADGTWLITLAVPDDLAADVRGMRRINRE